MIPLLQYVARFDRGERFLGLEGEESWPWCSVCRIPVSICCAKRRETSFTHVLEGDKPVHHLPRFSLHISIWAERCSRCRRSGVPAGSGRNGERSRSCIHAYF